MPFSWNNHGTPTVFFRDRDERVQDPAYMIPEAVKWRREMVSLAGEAAVPEGDPAAREETLAVNRATCCNKNWLVSTID